jgi:hypothetical protein
MSVSSKAAGGAISRIATPSDVSTNMILTGSIAGRPFFDVADHKIDPSSRPVEPRTSVISSAASAQIWHAIRRTATRANEHFSTHR